MANDGLETMVLRQATSMGRSALQMSRLAAGFGALALCLVVIGMGLGYLGLVLFVANPDALSFAWHKISSVSSSNLERYYRDRNLFLGIGAAGGLVVTLCVGLVLAGAKQPE